MRAGRGREQEPSRVATLCVCGRGVGGLSLYTLEDCECHRRGCAVRVSQCHMSHPTFSVHRLCAAVVCGSRRQRVRLRERERDTGYRRRVVGERVVRPWREEQDLRRELSTWPLVARQSCVAAPRTAATPAPETGRTPPLATRWTSTASIWGSCGVTILRRSSSWPHVVSTGFQRISWGYPMRSCRRGAPQAAGTIQDCGSRHSDTR